VCGGVLAECVFVEANTPIQVQRSIFIRPKTKPISRTFTAAQRPPGVLAKDFAHFYGHFELFLEARAARVFVPRSSVVASCGALYSPYELRHDGSALRKRRSTRWRQERARPVSTGVLGLVAWSGVGGQQAQRQGLVKEPSLEALASEGF